MKRAIACALLLMLALAAFGQEQPKVYVKSVPILKIMSHPEGYKVLYLKSDMKVTELYLPYRWFTQAGGKAEIVFGNDPSYPYFSVFYVDGKFDHIRLYVIENIQDPTWGILRLTEASYSDFNVESLNIEY
jgi:hypothetical protein